MLVKNFPIGILVGAVWGAVWTDLQTLYRLVRGKNKVAIKAILKGRFASLRTLPLYFKKRKLVRSHSKISKQDLLRLMDAV